MIQDETVKQLMAISAPKNFKQNEYICYEGQPGDQMYIILKGTVGVYVTNAIGTLTEVYRIVSGDFFGEMAIFDDLPRSASCIALEDTVCVSVSKRNLTRFFTKCPEVAAKLLENMSSRIRRLDDELYKTDRYVKNLQEPEFEIPAVYSFSHVVEKPSHDIFYTQTEFENCPICGEEICVTNLRRNVMHIRRTDPDRRVHYVECDPLWFDVISCPYCLYSNHYLSFFHVIAFKKDAIKQILKEQHIPVLEANQHFNTPFDVLVLKYLQAIHINETVNAGDNVLIGRLWLNLYWIACDSLDEKLALFFAEKAIEKIKKAIDENQISDHTARDSLALTLAHLFVKTGKSDEVVKYLDIASESAVGSIKIQAYTMKESIGKRSK